MGSYVDFGEGRFVVTRALGAGGMGVVYEVRDTQLDRTVALKTLKNVGATALYLFKNEFRALADLRHPNLIRFHELFAEKEPWFFTMELLDGADLLSWLRASAPRRATQTNETLAVDAQECRPTEPVHAPHPLLGGSADAPTVAAAIAPAVAPTIVAAAPSASPTLPSVAGLAATVAAPAIGASPGALPLPSLPRVVFPALAQRAPDDRAIRAAFAQLARALDALHRASKMHRDVKPSNVMVTREGRVVLMDFGLAIETNASAAAAGGLAGTPLYMAPEQLDGGSGPEADWYSFGVMLYEALAGRPPHLDESLRDLFEHKRRAPEPASKLRPDIPGDLDRLCCELLAPDPRSRPRAAEILARLGEPADPDAASAPSAASTSDRGARSSSGSQVVVGQESELAALADALGESRTSGAVPVLVCGESGIGKSTLLRRFLATVAAASDALVLSGRCYEQEFVPYKGFDGIVDALCGHLLSLPPGELAGLLPPGASILARVFPVLERVPALARAAPGAGDNPAELRNAAFSALRDIFARCAEKRPVVVFIDDLQWSDKDSLLLLAELVRPPAGRYLICATVRGDATELLSEHGALATLREMRSLLRIVSLGRLSRADALALVKDLSGTTGDRAEALVREAEGHPLFLRELALHAHRTSEQATTIARLDDVLSARVAGLNSDSKRLLTLVALAGAPIAQRTLARASGLGLAKLSEHVDQLRDAQLVRTMGRLDTDTVEPYHDRIRESVASRTGPGDKARHHLDLGVALEEAGAADNDPQALLRHFEAAGEHARAARHAERAADRAHRAFAFDQAAELLRAALRLEKRGAAETQRLQLALGDALGNAGRMAEAAEVFLEVAKDADPRLKFDCQRRAADYLCCTGHMARGMEILRRLLRETGEELPSEARALGAFLWGRAQLRLRGLDFRPVDKGRVPEAKLLRGDIYRSISFAVTTIEALAGSLYTLKTLLFALEIGEPLRIADALAGVAMVMSLEGPRSSARGWELVERSRTILASSEPDPMLQAWTQAAAGALDFWGSGFARAATDRDVLASVDVLRNQAGAAKRLSTVRLLRLTLLYARGDYHGFRGWGLDLVRDAIRRRDYYEEFTCTVLGAYAWLAADDPEGLQRTFDEMTPWTPMEDKYYSQHYYELRGRGDLALYTGDVRPALEQARRHLRLFPLAMKATPCMIGTLYWTMARLMLRAARGPGDPLLAEVGRLADKLDGLKLGFTVTQSRLARAAVALRTGSPARALALLDDAARLANAAEMLDAAAAARLRKGQILGGDTGRALVEEARATLSALGAKSPDRMLNVVAPGFDPP
jgi:serine/threonine protein kinase/tetratricopeptide (TPR) repeat protein